MKDWQWFAFGLIPFAGMPTHLVRYAHEGHVPGGKQLAAGFVAGQAVATGIGHAVGYPLGEHLAYYRLRSLGFGVEGYHAGRAVFHQGSGMVWRSTFPMRMSLPIFAGLVAGSIATAISGPYDHLRHGYYLQRMDSMHRYQNPDAPPQI